MNLEKFSEQEIKLLHELVANKIIDVDGYIKELKMDIAYKQIYAGEADDITLLITNKETGEEQEKDPEEFLITVESWRKDYEILLKKVEVYIDLINESK